MVKKIGSENFTGDVLINALAILEILSHLNFNIYLLWSKFTYAIMEIFLNKGYN